MSPPMSLELACAGCGCTNSHACLLPMVIDSIVVDHRPCGWAQVPGGLITGLLARAGAQWLERDAATAGIALCTACAPNEATRLAWPRPRACVAPGWPEWVQDEDGEITWIRADLVESAAALLIRDVYDRGDFRLSPAGAERMTLRRGGQTYGDPDPDDDGEIHDVDEGGWLAPVHADDVDSDQAIYYRFETC